MNVEVIRWPVMLSRVSDHVELTKPRITLMILFTVFLGYSLGAGTAVGWSLLPTLIGTALITSGTGAWNQYLERDLDGRMSRTRHRPLPRGSVAPGGALAFSLLLCGSGGLILLTWVNTLTAALAGATTLLYVLAYTPLKSRSSLATLIGAVPGALPPVGGWAAATGRLGPEAATLFAILFLWQVPHFLAIGWLHREDYAAAGMRMLPVPDPDGRATGRQVLLAGLALLPVSFVPTAFGFGGPLCFLVALVVGGLYAAAGLAFVVERNDRRARQLLMASILYIPLLGAGLILDRFGGW
ncbi:MAG: heme o synthase [Acidobacteriota bacterium]